MAGLSDGTGYRVGLAGSAGTNGSGPVAAREGTCGRRKMNAWAV